MLVLPGSQAVLPSKTKILLESIQRSCPKIISVQSIYIHLVHCTSDHSQSELSSIKSEAKSSLNNLLAYGDESGTLWTSQSLKSESNVAYVLPRPGSISPWSSKATNIAMICNLGPHIKRIERGSAFIFTIKDGTLSQADLDTFSSLIHDRMTQVVQLSFPKESSIFVDHAPKPLRTINLKADGTSGSDSRSLLASANKDLGLALSNEEIEYLVEAFVSGPDPINRDPTDAELFMFAQVNSEHCRHKIFNASWTIDGQTRNSSLFQMIRNTEKISGLGTISAYSDNAAVLEGSIAPRFGISTASAQHCNPNIPMLWQANDEDMPILIKVETHNHPTAVSPYPGAATGSGGEIRDEGAVGRGSKPKAGLSGFTVSNLLIPGFEQPWETNFGKPAHIASALDIMLEGPLGASAFNNEFGRPALTGYFRTFAEEIPTVSLNGTKGSETRGYHKPIMIAGGYGNVRPQFAKKTAITPGSRIVVLGGPGMLIGLGGGAASSQVSGASSAALDFASVQRDNAEMQRRCQQVIDACTNLGSGSPIESIHDVGAGGLSNALPELVHDSNLGATFEIRDVLVADSSMSPMEIWCNESQERYVLAIAERKLQDFEKIARRERCLFSIVGIATKEEELIVTDRLLGQDVIRLKMSTLFGKAPRMARTDQTLASGLRNFDSSLATYVPSISALTERVPIAIDRVLRLPSVGSKSFLITIGDRSITGLVTRDQMVGPWQVPVADVAVTRASYGFAVKNGEAMAMGERTPLALINPAASARMAIAEALTNIAAASIADIRRVKMSANWMCAASKDGQGVALFDAVQAVGMDLCPALGIGIPVGKDSMSMSMKWQEGSKKREISSPLSLIATAFSPVDNIEATWTPHLRTDIGEPTDLVFVDLANKHMRLGGSALAQVFKEIGSQGPDVVDPATLKAFFEACQTIRKTNSSLVLAYHDRSDGGLLTTLSEMCFAGHVGASISLGTVAHNDDEIIPALFNEELGAVFQVRSSQVAEFSDHFANAGISASCIHIIGHVNADNTNQAFIIKRENSVVYSSTRHQLQSSWAETSYHMQILRDNHEAANEEYSLISDPKHTGIFYDLSFSYAPGRDLFRRPKVAILREQGVNGQTEMAWAFTEAGFDAIDVHMSDILSGDVSLKEFRGLAACGGFSYGDVLGAGKGWAHSVLLNQVAKREFTDFFHREDSFTLAVCNGCQFLSHLRGIIPGANDWPEFKPNRSGRFEGRVSMVEILDTDATRSSVFLHDMVGSKLPVAVAHGEGRVFFASDKIRDSFSSQNIGAIRFIGSDGLPTETYPLNPNGSPAGLTGIQTPSGRVLALMPHPERVVTLESNSWYPPDFQEKWKGTGPWFRLFQNARKWVH